MGLKNLRGKLIDEHPNQAIQRIVDFENDYQLGGAPLSDLAVRDEARVVWISDQLQESFKLRLRELGFREGSLVCCQRNTPLGGPRIFEVGGAIFSLESNLTDFIFVEKI